MRKTYKLLLLRTTRKDDEFSVQFLKDTTDGYHGTEVIDNTFDTEEEALEFVKCDKDWHYTDFTIIPVYFYDPTDSK